MTDDATLRWLEPRLRDAPAELAGDILRLLAEVPESTRADPITALATAAVVGLNQVAAAAGGRKEALHLLAADAALTYAFEAAAESGRIAELVGSVGLEGELGERLAQATIGGTPPEEAE